ncbi:tetratricopeptide repeat protein [Leucobacter sp. cx-169]|uniref:tetratricopeptide repeat protein n=1 Tax=Leucobacter sp. cx-169 TaxID=2770549 RepID=UPI00165E8778|nr:sel1 repeat family protein [Leucobacter sp. cx-169]MBC9927261.1 sel1 repeat family protein [Leucobacter sp. cx-169]
MTIPYAKLGVATKHLDEGRIAEGMPLLRDAAEAGVPEAMLQLGILHELSGEDEVGFNWIVRAGESGSRDAMRMLSGHYMQPETVLYSIQWTKKLADAGDADAGQFLPHLVKAYQGDSGGQTMVGIILTKSGQPERAEPWFESAADLGNPAAMLQLAFAYMVPWQEDTALDWASRASAAGSPRAAEAVDVIRGLIRGDVKSMRDASTLLAARGHGTKSEQWASLAADVERARGN